MGRLGKHGWQICGKFLQISKVSVLLARLTSQQWVNFSLFIVGTDYDRTLYLHATWVSQTKQRYHKSCLSSRQRQSGVTGLAAIDRLSISHVAGCNLAST